MAPELEPAVIDGQLAIEVPVQRPVAGVPVRSIIDLIDTSGRIVDLKSAARTPSGVNAGDGLVRLDSSRITRLAHRLFEE